MPADLSIRILIVDDMPAMRSILRGMLEEVGFKRVYEAEDGEMAWFMIERAAGAAHDPFDLVLADWNMPGMSGIDLLRSVRNHPEARKMKFLMVTSQGSDARIGEALRAGADEYVLKPFNAPQLEEKINKVFSP